MTTYGLQPNFTNTLLEGYFGINPLEYSINTMYIGLGLNQEGATTNLNDFEEVYSDSYARASVVFAGAVSGITYNAGTVTFPTASESWTAGSRYVDMIGIFNTADKYDIDTNELILPLIVMRLPKALSVQATETLMLDTGAITLSLSNL